MQAPNEKNTVQILVRPWIRDALKKKAVDDRTTIQVLAERAIVRAYKLRDGAA